MTHPRPGTVSVGEIDYLGFPLSSSNKISVATLFVLSPAVN